MLQSVCTLLTVLSLLACPLTCMSDAAGATSDRSESATSCCHCGSQNEASGHPAGESHRGDPSGPCDPCANCMCRGAVVTKNDLSLEADASGGVPLCETHQPIDASLVAAAGPSLGAIDTSPPGVRSGRLIRYDLQSLLL